MNPVRELARRRVLVTGAAGFIGSHVVVALERAGWRVVGCDRLGRGEQWRYIAQCGLDDWIDPSGLLSWLDRCGETLDAVVHMGAISATTERDVDALVASNVRLTLDLWERAASHDWRFVYASSAATYGAGEQGFADRDDPEFLGSLRPLNAYGWSKHLVDRRICEDFTQGFAAPRVWAGLKFFNVYGPHEGHKGAMQSLVAKLIPVILAGDPIRLFRSHRPDFADGAQLRDFVYVRDAVASIVNILELPAQAMLGGLFNIGTGQPRSFHDLALATCAALGRDPEIAFIPMPEAIRQQYQYYTCADVTKARACGVHSGCWSLEEGVTDHVRSLGLEQGDSGHG